MPYSVPLNKFSTLKDSRSAPSCQLIADGEIWQGSFNAMASPCEVLIDAHNADVDVCKNLIQLAAAEVWRIEEKFSRYRKDNIVCEINQSNGQAVYLDEETAQLVDYAFQCYKLSGGLFDVSSGPLRRVWSFDGSEHTLDRALLNATLSVVGLDKCSWQRPALILPPGAELDLGGIGKEYAVDRVLQLLKQACQGDVSLLINFGGDLACSGPRQDGSAWVVGVESITGCSASPEQAPIYLKQGAIATSGDAHRYLMLDGKRLSHVLDPKSGFPVANAPQSVTVVAPSCTLAGMLATFAMLEGSGAEEFMSAQNVQYWIQRGVD